MLKSRIQALIFDPIRSFQMMHIMKQGAVFLSGIILAFSHWSIEDIGFLEWLFFLAYSFSYFWISGILQGFLASNDRSTNREGGLIWSVFLVLSGLGLLTWLAFVITGVVYDGSDDHALLTFILFGGWSCFNIVGTYFPYVLYVRQKIKWLNIYNAFYLMTYISIFFSLAIFQYDWYIFLSLLFLFGCVQFAVLIAVIFSISSPVYDKRLIINLVKEYLPLIGYVGIGGLATVFDGWLIHLYFSDSEVFAVYRYGARELPLSLAMAAAFSHAMVPYLSDNQENGLFQLRKRSKRIMHILFPISILLLLLSGDLFRWLYADRFEASVPIFDLMLLLVISRMVFSHTLLIAFKKNTFIFKVSLVELGVNIVLSVIFIQWFGILGVVLATIIAYAIEKIIFGVRVQREFNLSLADYTSVKTWAGYSGVLLISYLVKYL